jgi:hypothetical protein
MNKQELIDAIAGHTGASKAQTGETLDTLLEVVKKAVSKGDAVQLIGFGTALARASVQHVPAVIRRPVKPSRLQQPRRSSLPPAKRSRTPSTRSKRKLSCR